MIGDYVKFMLRADLQLALAKLRKKVYTKVISLDAEYFQTKEPTKFADRAKNELTSIRPNAKWTNDLYACSWFNFKGKLPNEVADKHVALLISIGAEGATTDENGGYIQGISSVNGFIEFMQPARGKRYIEFANPALGGEEIDLWVEGGNNKLMPGIQPSRAYFKQADVVIVRDDVKALYYDALALAFQFIITAKDDAKRSSIKQSIKNAVKRAKSFDEADVEAARAILQEEMQKGEDSPYEFIATGHAHLDLAWLWPIRETRRKAGRTFANQLRNIEKYDGYIFGASQPQQFEWVEEDYPDIYKQIEKAVASDRLEVQGGMWVECDTNVVSGESLIRQNLYGKKYWREKFNKDVNFCWLPDVFGFSGNLPQILKKCGVDYFLTIKLGWNEHNKFPKRTFIWEGIDDSQVLVHMPPQDDYNSDAIPIAMKKAVENNPEIDKITTMSMLYGIGDGGGGPGEGHLEMVKRENNMKGVPKVTMGTAKELFAKLETKRDKLDTVKGELYLEKHQGTYTTQSNNKYFNRKIEFLLHNVEFLYTICGLDLPKDKIDKIWKEILLYQFHDIIPGSSIARVYTESVARYEKIREELLELQGKALEAMSKGKGLSAVNPTGYNIDTIIKKDDKYYKAVVAPYAAAALTEYSAKGVVKGDSNTIESDVFKITFDTNGDIKSLFDKKNNKEVSKDYLNKFVVYKDKRLHYNAWDIDIDYPKKKAGEFALIHSKINVYVDDARVIRENLYSFKSSFINQKVILTAGKQIVEFVTTIDWQETHKMLRAEFNPSVYADWVTCDIQMGNLKRSTKNETSVEKAQFEICAHKWVDVSKDGYGLSILTDSKYGWRVKEGILSLNVLRSPMYPARDADKGKHTVKYALYPHKGDVYEADTAKLAYEFNNPLIISENQLDLKSLVSSSCKNIVIETVKPSENNEGVIVRAYEDSGKKTKAAISFGKEFSCVFETDLLENVIAEVDTKDLAFKPFEIKTFLFKS